ncbi:hypothetical protein GON26_17515 [Flavobacterium sp. GA093]|uniref:Uncharacterized protein n=1 Tax=Flavobacterium hydrocarbonoxydans TaxID=2683249 RepID=A0A6I4NYW6_9FLAO|nr:hypothetical protein [Flavobacterium hydrocarbonoxydans]MWB96164.1 hypothetical protein [Flavobacterium hydrocarbonoxydans]
MDLKKSQEKGIDEINFIKEIKPEIEALFIKEYQKLRSKINGLTESFSLDLKTFKQLLSDNQNKAYCKFYYLQKDDFLHIGLSFSDNDQCPIKTDDVFYSLEGDVIKDTDFAAMVTAFKEGIGAQLQKETGEEDVLTAYTLKNINDYLTKMERLKLTVYALKFNMWQYCPTDLDQEDAVLTAEFTIRNKRISFCVHALFNEASSTFDPVPGSDLGNLRP